jgi:branched-chain amino acid transport system permease protein
MKARPKLLLVAALAAAGLLSAFSGWMSPYHVEILITIGINITLAVSLNLINGYTGQFSLGHAGFMAVGAYTAAAMTVFLGPQLLGEASHPLARQLLFLSALLLGGLMAALSGLVVGAPSLRLRGDYLAIVTLGFGEIIRVIFNNVPQLGGSVGLTGIPEYTNLFWAFVVALVTIYTVLAMVHSSAGRGFVATHDDEVAAEAMGINTTKFKIVAFVVGAFFAGVAGGIYGHRKLFIDPSGFGFLKSIEIVVMVILGGMGNTLGVIAAAIGLTLALELLRGFSDYRMIVYSLLLIMVMLLRPEGLFRLRRKGVRTA